PKFDKDAKLELKGQFLKELREHTFSGSENEGANEHIETVLEIVDLFTTPDVTRDQLMFRVILITLTGAASIWLRNESTGSITTREILKGNFLSKYCPPARTSKKEVILFYKGLDVPTRQILDSKGVVPKMNAVDAKKAIQEMADYSQKWHNGASNRNKGSNTSDGLVDIEAQLKNLGREIKKVNERVYAVQVGCKLCNGPHYTKYCPLKKEGNTLKEAYYTQFGVPFPQARRYRAAAPGFYQMDNGNPSYQERRQIMKYSLSKFMVESAKVHDEHSSLIKEIRASTDVAIKNQGASIKALEIQIGEISKVLQERGSGSLPNSTETNPRDHVKSITTTKEAETPSIRRIGPHQYVVSCLMKGDKMPLIEFSGITISFPDRLKENYYDEKEVMKELKKLQVNSTESATSLRRLLKKKSRIKEEIKAKISEHCSTILKDALPLKEKRLREPKSKNAKVRVNTEESAVKPEPELKNTIGCNLNPSDGPGKPNSITMKTVKTKWALNQFQQPICVQLTKTVKTLKAQS
ncbi:hypothetical protein Tco_0444840, partial [Tanacetum coccineum]